MRKVRRVRVETGGMGRRMTALFMAGMLFFGVTPVPLSAELVTGLLPAPGTPVFTSPAYQPAVLRGVRVHGDRPFLFDFLLDPGARKGADKAALKEESERLVKYFLAAMTIPDDEAWVNLSPYEADKIAPESLGATLMGRDMLAQDYLLKQVSASLTHPQTDLGRKFWDRVYRKARERFGTIDIPLNTFSKVWIVPDRAVVLESGDTAVVAYSRLKVMLESDYKAVKANAGRRGFGMEGVDAGRADEIGDLTAAVVREVVIPELEKEVNFGKNFAPARQIYHSVILAAWYKRALRESLLGKVYVDRDKIAGVDIEDKSLKEKIYERYLEAFRKGVYHLIREEKDPVAGKVLPRKYFSGGFNMGEVSGSITYAALNETTRQVSGLPEEVQAQVGRVVAAYNRMDLSGWEQVRVQLAESPIEEKELTGTQEGLTPYARAYTAPISAGRIAETVGEYRQEGRAFREATEEFSAEAGRVADYLKETGLAFRKLPVTVIATDEVTFGAAVLPDENGEDRLYIEQAFLDEIQEKGNPYDMRARMLLYAMVRGTRGEKRVAEYEYAKARFPGLSERLPANVERIYSRILEELIPEDVDMARRIRTRYQQLLWEIGVHMMNGDIDPTKRVRWNRSDREFAEDESYGETRVMEFATAGNPLHLGHIEPMLRAMAYHKIDQVGVLIAGVDERKPILTDTEAERHEMAVRLFNPETGLFGRLIVYSGLSKGTSFDGEHQLGVISELNAKRKGRLTIYYFAGTDHMHVYAPGDWETDAQGNPVRHPKTAADGSYKPDTILKIWNLAQEHAEALKERQHALAIIFNEREPEDGIPMVEEQERLDRLAAQGFYVLLSGKNFRGASSTAIREALAGVRGPAALTILPRSLRDYIDIHDTYRARITKLPAAMKKLVSGEGGDKEKRMVRQWVLTARSHGVEISPRFLAADFGLDEETVSRALAAALQAAPEELDGQEVLSLGETADRAIAPAGLNVAERNLLDTIAENLAAAPKVDAAEIATFTSWERLGRYLEEIGVSEAHVAELARKTANAEDLGALGGATFSVSLNRYLSNKILLHRIVGPDRKEKDKAIRRAFLAATREGGAVGVEELARRMGSVVTPEEVRKALTAYEGAVEMDGPGEEVLYVRPGDLGAAGVSSPVDDEFGNPPGGIDFDPSFMDLQIKRDGRGIPLPIPQQDLRQIRIEGLYPVIIDIAPATPLTFPLLGAAADTESSRG